MGQCGECASLRAYSVKLVVASWRALLRSLRENQNSPGNLSLIEIMSVRGRIHGGGYLFCHLWSRCYKNSLERVLLKKYFPHYRKIYRKCRNSENGDINLNT
jgi:hypothetical protein